MSKRNNKKQTVRNEQESQLTQAEQAAPAQKPDDLHRLILDMTHDAVHAQGLADRMLTLAKGYCDEAGILDVTKFSADCATQEAWITSDKAGKEKASRVPRNWVNVKSNILRAVKPASENGTGKPLTEFGTMHELRKALPRKPRQPKADKAETVVPVGDVRIQQALDGILQKMKAAASLSNGLNAKGLDDLHSDLVELDSDLAATLKYFKDNAAAYTKEPEKVTGAQAPEPLDVDEEPARDDLTAEEIAQLQNAARH